MLKTKLILLAIKIAVGAIALGVGIWYMSSSIGGASLGHASLSGFLGAIGVTDGDIASAGGCFLCGYIEKLFAAIGGATEMFWNGIVGNLWILMAVGFGIYLFVHTGFYLYDASKQNAKLDGGARTLDFKKWFGPIWKLGLRILIAGVFLGALNLGGNTALRATANITITPVMYVGAELSMVATGISDAATCVAVTSDKKQETRDILNPVMQPFMCIMGNLNATMLAGASGGFALMNYAWMGLGGGAFTWLAGLALVIMFLIIGFDLFFQILSVIFKLVFLIIFMPLIIAAGAFEGTWKLASGLVSKSITMLVTSAVKIVAITLKIVIVYATVSFAADEYFPGPNDGYNAILPPLITTNTSTNTVMNVFLTCEKTATINGEIDKDTYKNCFTAQRAMVEREHPGAFDFMGNGLEFIMLMIGIFLLYFYAVSPKIDALIAKTDGKEEFDYGTWVKDLGKRIFNAPTDIAEKITKATEKK